jgi:hypothetical protein
VVAGPLGLKAEKEGGALPPFFFKADFKLDFESSFEFESTTQYKNPMQQHECTFM